MNRYGKLYRIVKALKNPFVGDSTGHRYSVSPSYISYRCHSCAAESQSANNSQTAERNVDSCETENLPSKHSNRKPRRNYSVIQPAEAQDLSDYGSVLKPSFNFAAYADKSPLIQKLIELGVRLYEWEKNPEAVEFILQLDFDKKIKPYLSFLLKHGVPTDQLGNFITKNPFIFKESMDDLEVRINYLKSKKFDEGMIANIITRNPKWLLFPVKKIDDRLGYLQETFHLKGDEVRSIITRVPNLIKTPIKTLHLNVLTLKEEMELEEPMVKKLVVNEPRLLKMDPHDYLSSYDYLRRVMKIPQSLILKTPQILNHRKHKLYERHKYLESLGKAQYNPLLPGYVALSTFYTYSDAEFCEKITKTSLETYYMFLKTF